MADMELKLKYCDCETADCGVHLEASEPRLICPKCGVPLVLGVAFNAVETQARVEVPIMQLCTEADLIDVYKCSQCGYSELLDVTPFEQ
jgi:predicted RNA-binding Zn-ribbon protein involved in translation (DUF1610 family)